MPERWLEGCRILVVEDEYLIADDLCSALTEAGAQVLGPAADVLRAEALIAAESVIDGALLDINLNGAKGFPVADMLSTRGVPFIFATGYDRWAIPDHFAHVPRLEKPIRERQLKAVLGPLVAPKTCSPPSVVPERE